jgi:hypothetical protein
VTAVQRICADYYDLTQLCNIHVQVLFGPVVFHR